MDAFRDKQLDHIQYERLRTRAQRASWEEIRQLMDGSTSRVELLLSLAGLASITLPLLTQILSQNNPDDHHPEQQQQEEIDQEDYQQDEFGVDDFESYNNNQHNYEADMTEDVYDNDDADECVDC